MKKQVFAHIYKAVLVALVIVLLCNIFWQGFYTAITFLAVLLILGCWPFMSSGFKKPTAFFLGASFVGLLVWHEPPAALLEGTHAMIYVVAIIIILQTFSIPIAIGGYDRALERMLFKYNRSKNSLFCFISICTHFIGSFMLFGTTPVMVSLFGPILQKRIREYEHFIATAISRGYALMSLWAPGAVNILLVQQSTGVKWSSLFIPGLVLGLVGLITSFALERKVQRPEFQDPGEPNLPEESNRAEADRQAMKKVVYLIMVIAGMICLTFLFEFVEGLTSTQRVMLAGLIVGGCWIFIYRKHPDVGRHFAAYWDNGINKAVDLAALFVAMGVFSNVVESSNILSHIPLGSAAFSGYFGLLICLSLPLVIIICSCVGIHPFISIVLAGSIISSLGIPVPKLPLALALALGGAISYATSPFAGLILTLSSYLNRSASRISLRWNGLFSLLFYLEGIAIIGLVYLWG